MAFGPWTWGGNDRTYREAAEVTYTQPFWENGVREDRTATMHLVLDHGQWRWFLGTDPAWLRSLPREGADDEGELQGIDAATTGQPDQCADAERWWSETLARWTGISYTVHSFWLKSPGMDPTIIAEYAETLAGHAEDQRASNPPAAGEQLNTELAAAFDAYAQAIEVAATLAAGVDKPFQTPLVAQAVTALDRGDSAMERASGLGGTFVEQCAPVGTLSSARAGD